MRSARGRRCVRGFGRKRQTGVDTTPRHTTPRRARRSARGTAARYRGSQETTEGRARQTRWRKRAAMARLKKME
jgi:hypothetical protein